jgi:hypothetical protein
MSGFEDRLRAAMESSVAGEHAPAGLLEGIRRRHRRHLARVAVAWAALLLAGVAAIPPSRAALLGHGALPVRSPATLGPVPRRAPAVRGQSYSCTSGGAGSLGPHWRQDAAHAGPVWFINDAISPGFRFRTKDGMLKAVPIIVAVPNGTTAYVKPVGSQARQFRFLPGFNRANRYTLHDGKTEATFTGCPGPSGSGAGLDGFTAYWVGTLVAGPRCITLGVQAPGTAHVTRATLRFGRCTR